MIRRTPNRRNSARAFTLVELTLTLVIGSLVMVGVYGVFAATRSADRVFGTRFEHTSEMAMTQRTIRRAMLTLFVEETSRTPARAVNPENDDRVGTVGGPRPRIVLEPDPSMPTRIDGWYPQRFELVLSAPPIAPELATSSIGWGTDAFLELTSAQSGADSLVPELNAAQMRGVFELRPDGSREDIMHRVGLLSDNDWTQQDRANQIASITQGWTLWWRPISPSESSMLALGNPPLPDGAGTADDIRSRFAGAVRLLRNIDTCIWEIFRGDEKIQAYQGTYQEDIPAYIEFEVLLTNQQYATWMFEIDWETGTDPDTAGSSASGDEDDQDGADNDDDGAGSGSNGTDDDNSDSRPTIQQPRPTTVRNMGGDT